MSINDLFEGIASIFALEIGPWTFLWLAVGAAVIVWQREDDDEKGRRNKK